jgi:hypothetical protein
MIEYKRIYHSHIRKCAGTSFNKLVLGMECDQDPKKRDDLYAKLCKNLNLKINDKVYVCHNNSLINSGNYYYAFSHSPYWSLNIPKDTFVITTIRNPVERLTSHYQMIKEYYDNNVNHSCMSTEGLWLGKNKTFLEFVTNMPKNHKCAQLYHYSKNYSIDEAIENISKVDFIGRVETLTERGYDALKKIIPQLNFPNEHLRKSKKQNISQVEIDYAKELLEEEYKLIKRVEFSY